MIRRLSFADVDLARQIADLHCREITGGVLGMLGPRFLGVLYRYIANAQGSAVWADVESGSLRGFICGCRDDKAMFRSVIARGWPRLSIVGFISLWRRGVLSGVISTAKVLIGPSSESNQPRAQLLSTAVAENHRRKGVASGLIVELHKQMGEWNVDRTLVWTTESNSPALSLYENAGYVRTLSVRHSPEDMVGLVRVVR